VILAPGSAAGAERRAHDDGWLTVEQEGIVEHRTHTCVDAIGHPTIRVAASTDNCHAIGPRRAYTKAVFELTAIDDAETVADHVR
jgi:hypothetical protein